MRLQLFFVVCQSHRSVHERAEQFCRSSSSVRSAVLRVCRAVFQCAERQASFSWFSKLTLCSGCLQPHEQRDFQNTQSVETIRQTIQIAQCHSHHWTDRLTKHCVLLSCWFLRSCLIPLVIARDAEKSLTRLSERKEEEEWKDLRTRIKLYDFISGFLLVRLGQVLLPVNMLQFGSTDAIILRICFELFCRAYMEKMFVFCSSPAFFMVLLPSRFLCQILCSHCITNTFIKGC